MNKLYELILAFYFFQTVFSLNAQDAVSKEFNESFDNPALPAWNLSVGEWEINNNELSLNKGFGYSMTKDDSYTQFTYEADVTLLKKGNAGLLFNIRPASFTEKNPVNTYCLSLSPHTDTIELSKMVLREGETKPVEKQVLIGVKSSLNPEKKYRIKVQKKGDFIDAFLNGEHMISFQEKSLNIGAVGFLSDNSGATFDNVNVKKLNTYSYNWSWVKGAIYIPTNCVNQIQQWEEFDPKIVDRELRYAGVYGLNTVRIYLHYLVYEKDKNKFLNDLETFLQIADKYKLKTIISFFDDVWDGEPHLGPQLPPVTGRHNKRWAQCPGNYIKDNYPAYKDKLKSYVQDVVKLHLDDPRVLFWEPYNEPGFLMKGKYLAATRVLLNDSRIWIKETGTPLPITSTADPDFAGKDFSDFYSWHSYNRFYEGPEGPEAINTECMNRTDQTLAGLIDTYGKRNTGYIIWELGIGRTNSRFNWISPENSPEPSMPFQGLIYPDGHPWDTNEVALIRGRLDDLPVFNVKYFTGNFALEKKWSFTPSIDFDLGDERGTGSPDASIGIDKDDFSIRWTGIVEPAKTGKYTFFITSDNVARLWINNKLVIDKNSAVLEDATTELDLDANKKYDLKVEYYHKSGEASMHVFWNGPDFPKEVLPGKRPVFQAAKITKESMFSTK